MPHPSPTTDHTTDTDCTLDASDSCAECGVYHGEPCDQCGGRGFHSDGCMTMGAVGAPESSEPKWFIDARETAAAVADSRPPTSDLDDGLTR